MELVSPSLKTISRIEPGGFRSPQFVFSPTKDCVEGMIHATVTYLDSHDHPRTIHVEPYTIRSVCDLLKPLESTLDEFEFLLTNMETSTEKMTMNWNPQVLFSKAKNLLPAKNFSIIDAKASVKDGVFMGVLKGLAEGKYTGKKVAIRIYISGNAEGTESTVSVESMGDDLAMVPITTKEITNGMDSWTCLHCGGALDPEEVMRLRERLPIQCKFCGHTLSLELYRK